MENPDRWRKVKSMGPGLILLALVPLAWVIAIYIALQWKPATLQDWSGLATVLFGAASLALFIFSILVAVVATLGWQQILEAVRKTARETAEATNAPLTNELRGRALTILGHVIGEMSLRPDSIKPADPDRLVEAVKICDKGYYFLKQVGGPAEYLALNNLVYYSCAAEDRSRSEFLIKSAQRLLEAGQEHNAINLQLTACRVFLQFGNKTQNERAIEILRELEEDSRATERERKEAKLYLASFLSSRM